MALSKKLLNLLEKNKVAYETVKHKTVYTAFDMAKTLKTKMEEVVKVILVKVDKAYVLVVLPGSRMLNLKKLTKALKAKKVSIAQEGIMKKLFKVEPGAMTPFGTLYKIPVYFDKDLAKTKKVVARGGSFQDSITIKTKDLIKLSQAKLADISEAFKKAARTKKARKK